MKFPICHGSEQFHVPSFFDKYFFGGPIKKLVGCLKYYMMYGNWKKALPTANFNYTKPKEC